MRLTAIVECCKETGLYVGYVPGFPGAHSQGETLDELNKHLREVITMLIEDGGELSLTRNLSAFNKLWSHNAQSAGAQTSD